MRRHPGQVFSAGGDQLALGRELGRGGEGAVYEVAGSDDVVAKVYHEPATPEKSEKLATMASIGTQDLLQIAAWPLSPLYPRPRENRASGVLLPRIRGFKDIHRLYGPAHRKLEFPRADWAFLLYTARNLAAAFGAIHAHGHVIGDVNQGNVVVSPQAIVKFIDCDSFQITANGRRFLCEVGVAHFTPPELQGASFDGIERTPNHDNFGLAVLCFHLLFMGRHPFAGRFLGQGDMPIERAIREFRFAFTHSSTTRQMTPPPFALQLAQVSTRVAALFERSFAEATARGSMRPTPLEWVEGLDDLRQHLHPCDRTPVHKYFRRLGRCPWCQIEEQGGPYFFISLQEAAQLGSAFDINAVWAAIAAAEQPSLEAAPATQTARPTGRPIPQAWRTRKLLTKLSMWSTLATIATCLAGAPQPVGWSVALAVGIIWLVLRATSPYDEERKRRQQALDAAKKALDAAKAEWQRTLEAGVTAFEAKRRELEKQRNDLQGLPATYQRERLQLDAKREELQRTEFLRHHFIDKARIKGIGPSLVATLASYNIETAADITRDAVDNVPNFGQVRTQQLLGWRATIERRFRFDPSKGIDPTVIAALNQKFTMRRQEGERALRRGPQELEQVRRQALERRQSLLPRLRQLGVTVAQADADFAIL